MPRIRNPRLPAVTAKDTPRDYLEKILLPLALENLHSILTKKLPPETARPHWRAVTLKLRADQLVIKAAIEIQSQKLRVSHHDRITDLLQIINREREKQQLGGLPDLGAIAKGAIEIKDDLEDDDASEED